MATKTSEQNESAQHHINLRKTLLKKLSIVWIFLLLIAIFLVGTLIKFYFSKSSPVLNQILDQKLEEQKVSSLAPEIKTYRSDSYGFEISYNPLVLRPDRSTDLTKPNADKIRLTLTGSNKTGFGIIDLSAQKPELLTEINNNKQLQGSDLLEKSANWYQNSRLKDLTDTSQYVSKEKIKRWDVDAYKLTYKRRLLGKDVFHYSYVLVKNNKLYTITTDYPKFGNSPEIIENWIDSISFFDPSNPESLVKGTLDQKPDLNEVKLVELSKPSVVQIISINCVTISTNPEKSLKFLKPKYEICNGGGGSGFMVGKEGIVATNGHVAKASFEDLVVMGKAEPGSNNFTTDFAREFLNQVGDSTQSADPNNVDKLAEKYPSTLDALFQKITDAISQGIIFKPQFSDRYFVKLGNDPIRFAQNNKSDLSLKNIKPAERKNTIVDGVLVDYDFAGLTALQQAAASAIAGVAPSKKEKSSDVAIIKLKSEQTPTEYPGLPLLSSAQAKEGQSILVVGYPGIVSGQSEGTAGLLDETSSSARPTITRGIISAIKQDTYGQTLLQTDASIEHGNSGGPSFIYDGNVIGIATYVISSGSGNYNFLRATDDLFALLEKNKIDKRDQSQTYTYWKEGLNFFWNSQFTKAAEQFHKVKELYPLHPQVDEYLTNSQKGIDEGQDADLQNSKDLKSFGYTQTQIAWFILAIILIIFGTGAALSTYLLIDHKKKKNEQAELVKKLQQMSTQQPTQPQKPS